MCKKSGRSWRSMIADLLQVDGTWWWWWYGLAFIRPALSSICVCLIPLSLQGIQPYLSSHDLKLTTFTINGQPGKILVLQIACCQPFIVRRFYQVWDMSLFCNNLDTFREFLLIVVYFVAHLSILAMFST